jgi:ParB-like chromosome segregation protein Spo0J
VFTFSPSDVLEGGVSLLSQRRSEMLNNPDFLTSVAFKKTQPSEPGLTPAEYMPEPGATSPLIPSFLHKALPPSMRSQGVPEQSVVDAVDNKEYGDSHVPIGATGKDGVMVRPAGALPEPQNPIAKPRNPALPPMPLFQRATVPQSNRVEAVGIPETAEPHALRNHFEKRPHPDVPNGNVVGLDAETNLPIIKRESVADQSQAGRDPVAPNAVVAESPQAPLATAEQTPSSSSSESVPESQAEKIKRANELARSEGSTQEDGSFGPAKSTNPIIKAAAQSRLPGRPSENVRMVDTKSLVVDPDEMQWRKMPRNSIKEGSEWDQKKAGPIDVWYNSARKAWQVVDGHHRINHALKNGVPEIEARVQEFPDVQGARQFGALRNIEQGNATPFDAALYLRESGATPDFLESKRINTESDFVKKASSLANLSQPLWDQYRTGNLEEARAVAIGKLSDKSQQSALANLASRSRLSAAEIEQAARRIEAAGSTKSETQSLFGTDEKSVSNFVETARVAAKIEKQLLTDKTALKFIADAPEARKAALARANNIINIEKSTEEALTAQVLVEGFRKLQNRSGEVQRLLDEAGARITKGEGRDVVYNEIYPKIREAIRKEIGGGQGDGPFPGGGSGGNGGSGEGSGGRSDAKGEASDEQGPVAPEGAGDLFRKDGPRSDTPEFKKWFGKSKVVDDSGRPLIVYHGSPDARFMAENAVFKSQKERFGLGEAQGAHWFTSSRKTAASYTDDHRAFDYQNAEPGVVPAFLKMENPLVIDAGGREWREAQRVGKTSDVIAKAREGGHDGVIIRSVKDDYINDKHTKPVDTYVVFDSKQIKHATSNSGAFNPDSDNILERGGKDGKRNVGDIISNARNIDYTYHQASGRIPAYLEVSEPSARILRHILESSEGAVGANISEVRGVQLAGRLRGLAEETQQYDRAASEKLSRFAAAVEKATNEYDGHNFVVKTANTPEMAMRTQEELFHSAVQRRAGSQNIQDAIPPSMYEHDVIRKMVPNLDELKPEDKVNQVAEVLHDMYSGEAGAKLSDEEITSTLGAYFDALVDAGKGERVLDAKAVKEYVKSRFGDRISPERITNDKPAREAIERVAGRVQSASSSQHREADGRLLRGEGRGEGGASEDGQGSDSGSEGDLTRPQGQGLDNSDLHSWVRQARTIEVKYFGSQPSLLNPQSHEAIFQLTSTDANGDVEKHLVRASELSKLREFAPFQKAEARANQQGMFGADSGEIVGSGKRGGIELPPQATDSQGTLFRGKNDGVTPKRGAGDKSTQPKQETPAGARFVEAEDERGKYRKIGDAVDVNGNWGRLKELPDEADVILFHATTEANAAKIMKEGFTRGDKPTNYGGDREYTYMGGHTGLGSYLGGAAQNGGKPVLMAVKVKKSMLEPDNGSDWKSHFRNPSEKQFAKKYGINIQNPSAVDSYAIINQVRARNEHVTPIGIYDENTGQITSDTSTPPSSGGDLYRSKVPLLAAAMKSKSRPLPSFLRKSVRHLRMPFVFPLARSGK